MSSVHPSVAFDQERARDRRVLQVGVQSAAAPRHDLGMNFV